MLSSRQFESTLLFDASQVLYHNIFAQSRLNRELIILMEFFADITGIHAIYTAFKVDKGRRKLLVIHHGKKQTVK